VLLSASATNPSARKSQSAITHSYDRLARFYRAIEPLFLILPTARRKAVAALDLKPGNAVLEIGAGTGRNLPYLVEAVGPSGTVIAVDVSEGMLSEARKLVERHGWSNVQLLAQDAAQLQVDRELDAVLFSLSYSVLPEPRPALARAWERMRPESRVVVMDAGLPDTRLGRLLAPVARLLVKLAPGDPYSRPWDDLGTYAPVETERFLLGLYYVSAITKPEETH
jgi:ubiquinone/menaquinone biosynthesis C-methylase UbiE